MKATLAVLYMLVGVVALFFWLVILAAMAKYAFVYLFS